MILVSLVFAMLAACEAPLDLTAVESEKNRAITRFDMFQGAAYAARKTPDETFNQHKWVPARRKHKTLACLASKVKCNESSVVQPLAVLPDGSADSCFTLLSVDNDRHHVNRCLYID
jgi:hypothetical protein